MLLNIRISAYQRTEHHAEADLQKKSTLQQMESICDKEKSWKRRADNVNPENSENNCNNLSSLVHNTQLVVKLIFRPITAAACVAEIKQSDDK